MECTFLEEKLIYTGKELSPQFNYLKTGLLGDSMVSWVGPCDVKTDHLVDSEDKLNQDFIYSSSMLHFLVEIFHQNIFFGIWLQRFMTMQLKEVIFEKTGRALERKGDDLYFISEENRQKLNVSIATASAVSTLLHFGVNVEAKGAPVPAVGLSDFGLNPKDVAEEMTARVQKEILEIYRASKKVISV